MPIEDELKLPEYEVASDQSLGGVSSKNYDEAAVKGQDALHYLEVGNAIKQLSNKLGLKKTPQSAEEMFDRLLESGEVVKRHLGIEEVLEIIIEESNKEKIIKQIGFN